MTTAATRYRRRHPGHVRLKSAERYILDAAPGAHSVPRALVLNAASFWIDEKTGDLRIGGLAPIGPAEARRLIRWLDRVYAVRE